LLPFAAVAAGKVDADADVGDCAGFMDARLPATQLFCWPIVIPEGIVETEGDLLPDAPNGRGKQIKN
jgi:hypothetical protein